MVGTLVMAPKSVTFRRHDHLVSVLFGDLLSHSYNITFSMFLYLVELAFTLLYSEEDIGGPIALVIWGCSVCNGHGALYHYGAPKC